MPRSRKLEVKNFTCLKTEFEASKTTSGIHLYMEFSIKYPLFIKDISEIFFALKKQVRRDQVFLHFY